MCVCVCLSQLIEGSRGKEKERERLLGRERETVRERGKDSEREGSLTNRAEVEEQGQLSAAGQAGAGLAQLVEEGVGAGLQRGQPRHGRVLQQARAQGDGLCGRAGLKHLGEEERGP